MYNWCFLWRKIQWWIFAFFNPTRGIIQGDPLFPYLLILVANVPSFLMKPAVEDGRGKGIKLNGYCPSLSHLLFANDVIFFLDGKVIKSQNLVDTLNQYCYAMGHAINLNKSGIFFSPGCPQNLRRNMARALRVPKIDKSGELLGILLRMWCLKETNVCMDIGQCEYETRRVKRENVV